GPEVGAPFSPLSQDTVYTATPGSDPGFSLGSCSTLYVKGECFRALCCKGPPPPRPEYDVVCIGLTGAGKTSLLSRLCSEGSDGIVPTTGADNIKKYWSRYYQGSQGVVFVLDSASSDEELEAARNELHSALQHPQLCTLPSSSSPTTRTSLQRGRPTSLWKDRICFSPVEINRQSLTMERMAFQPSQLQLKSVKKYFELEPLARGKRWVLEGSSTDNLEAVKESFGQFISLLEDKDTEPARI
ncbi:hypothetical protein KUCAC02_029156, partial [Chaenocephalus aceratus]